MRPISTADRDGLGPVGKSWNSTSLLQGSTVMFISFAVLGMIILVLHPTLLSRIVLRLECSRASLSKAMRVLLVCAAFMFIGPLLMVLNKEILQTLHFDFPLTLSGLGLMTTAVVVRGSVACGLCEVRPQTQEAVAEKGWCWAVLPIAMAKATTLACGNAVYLHLGLGFIQMLKAFNPVIVVFVMRLCGLALPSRTARWGVYLIISGTLVEVKGELKVTLLGVLLMMTSEVMEAVNLVLTQKFLQNCKFTLVESVYLIAPPSSALLFGAAIVLELSRMSREEKYRVIIDHPEYFAASCVLGLAVNFVGMAVVQATSSLTIKVLNTIRGIGVVFVGILFYGEYCTTLELCGYAVAIGGFTLYNLAQYISIYDKTECKIDRNDV